MQIERVDVVTVGVGLEHRARAHGQTLADLDVRELTDAGRQRPVEHVGLAQAAAVVQPHSLGHECLSQATIAD